jgi:hypothetical protein
MSVLSSLRPGRRPDPTVREQWQQRLDRFEQSGLSAAAFCSAEGLALPSFYSWRRRLRPATQAAPAELAFVPVRLSAPAAPVEVALPSGAVLRLSPGCDLAFVRSLVDALGGQTC